MTRFLVCERSQHGRDAGDKARDDIRAILQPDGWRDFAVHRGEDKGLADKLACLPAVFLDWRRAARTARLGDVMLVQYPQKMYPKVALAAVPGLRRLHRDGVRLCYLVHDLESLRGYPSSATDRAWLAEADVIIAHNQAMIDALHGYGLACPMVDLNIFDYLADLPQPRPARERAGIDIAGSLAPNKAGYVYRLAGRFPDATFNLYGPKFETSAPEKRWYRGSFPPDVLPGMLSGRFGLVWDGDDVDTCAGQYGRYLRVNNPHKMSLYLASGMPVIVWNQAAQADFVRREHAGITVNGIAEAVERTTAMSEGEYERYARAAGRIGRHLRAGDFTRTAVDEAMAYLAGMPGPGPDACDDGTMTQTDTKRINGER